MNSQASEQRDKQEMRDEINELKKLVAELAPAKKVKTVEPDLSGVPEGENIKTDEPELDLSGELDEPKPKRTRRKRS